MHSRSQLKRVINVIFTIFIAVAASLGAAWQPAGAQGVAQVSVSGIPPVLDTPFPDRIEENFRSGRYQVMFTYTGSSSQSKEFRFAFALSRNGDELMEVVSEPRGFTPGTYVFTSFFDDLPFSQDADAVIEQLKNELKMQVVQEGTIPEGQYTIRIQAIPEDEMSGIANPPAMAPFKVQYPQPPVLLSPPDENNVVLETPVFSWTPVVNSVGSTFRYHFLLVELLDNQTATQAINANRALAEVTLEGQTTLPYTSQFLPLEEGHQYVWRVTAEDVDGRLPLKNEGQSDINTFTYRKEKKVALDKQALEEIVLQPGFATLTDLQGINIDDQGGRLVLNGKGTLNLQFGREFELDAEVQNLSIQKNSGPTPVVTGGRVVTDDRVTGLPALRRVNRIVGITEVRWQHGQGVQATGQLRMPDGSRMPAEGWTQLSQSGLSGTLRASDPNGIVAAGSDPVEMTLTSVEASFPSNQLYAKGDIDLFSGEFSCRINQLNVLANEAEMTYTCPDDAAVTLVKNSAKLQLLLSNFRGGLDYDFSTDQLSYQLNAQGNVTAGLSEQASCSAVMQVQLDDANGFSVSQIQPTCSIYAEPLDLGLVQLKPNAFNLKSLAYNGGGSWNFDLSLDGAMTIPAMNDWVLPITTVNVTSGGLQFPALSWDKRDLGLNKPLTVGGFGIMPTQFEMDKFTFPWFDWEQKKQGEDDPGNWAFNLDFDFHFPNGKQQGAQKNGNILPSCVAAKVIPVTDAEFEKGAFSADIPATVLQDCEVELAQKYKFVINELGGELSADASASKFEWDSELDLDAHLIAGSPFNCGDDGPAKAAETSLTMKANGLLEGSVEEIINECSASIGPFNADITESELIFDIEGGKQKLTIDAGADLILNSGQKVRGRMVYNVLEGKFDELDFKLNEPFVWNIPDDKNPVLTFLIEQMELDETGLLIDGRHQFLMSNQMKQVQSNLLKQSKIGKAVKKSDALGSMTVTFDQVRLGLQQLQIQSGRIIFDETFGLQAGIDPQSKNLDFSILRSDEEISMEPNTLYTLLAGTVIVDKNGLHTSGRSDAGINVGDTKLDELAVDFSKDFSMELSPFGVQSGQADLLHDNSRFAWVDNSGLHIDPSYITRVVPDTLGLPTKDIAYVVLRDQQDSLLVDATKESDGTFTMSTTAPIDLVIPKLKGSRVAPPTTKVSFSNITYDPQSKDVTVGYIEGDFDPDIELTDMGVPFKLKKIRYGDGFSAQTNMNQQFGRGLWLKGDLLLYKHEMGDQGEMALYLENGNRLRGEADLQNLDADIPLVPQSDLAVLNVDSLKGTVNVPLDQLQVPDVDLDLGGEFRLQKQDQSLLAALNYRATYKNQNFTLNAINQPNAQTDSNAVFAGAMGFRVSKIKTLNLSYRSATNDFDFRSELDFSVMMDMTEGDTLEVPLKSVEITETGFSIPSQTINSSSQPVLSAPPFELGPTELTLLEFRILNPITFNWFTGQGFPPTFEMDLDMKLDALAEKAPQASQATITLNNVGFNQGIITGQIYPYTFQGDGVPVSLGGNTNFMLTSVGGGLTNDGTNSNPVQGFDIDLTGSLQYPSFFENAPSQCDENEVTVNLSKAGGLTGTISQAAPCGELVYGPATLAFDQATSLEFAFNNQTQQVILDGGVTAEIERETQPAITATGNIRADVINGTFMSGSIAVNDIFTYEYPKSDPLFTFRVQQATLDQNGIVFTGDAGLAYPNSQDTARVRFTNFTIHPQDEGITSGSLTIRDSLAIEVGISPIDWKIVDPSSTFDRNNAGRLLTTAGITIDQNGLTLDGSSEASIRAGGQNLPDLSLDYAGLNLNFSPTRITAGKADFTMSGENTPFGHLDKDGFDLDIPGLITSVIPDTIDIPNRNTAYLVLGDNDGNRYELNDSQTPRTLRTLQGKTVDLVIPGFKNSNDTLKTQVAFDVTVDQFFNVNGGSITLQNDVDLEPFTQLPITITELGYDGNKRELTAGATVKLPQSLNNVDMTSSLVIDESGFKQATIAAGEYRTNYLPSQENVTPIAADTLGQGALEFYVRGLEIELGQNKSIAFSGQLKSDLLKDSQDQKSPLHYAASYATGSWDFNVDASHLTQNGIDLGYAKVDPIQDPQGQYPGMFDVVMNQQEFAVKFAGVVSLPDVAGDGFSVTVEQLKIGSQSPYVSISGQANLPNQEFTLFGDVMTFKTTNTAVSFDNRVLAISLDGTFDFYTEQDVNFSGLEFRSDGTVNIDGDLSANLLPQRIEVLSDSALVLKELNLTLSNQKLGLAALGSAKLPKPLEATSELTISADTDGNVDVSGPNFVFDQSFNIDGDPTEFAIGSFATLELTGLGMDVDLKNPGNTALYAAGVIFIENNVDKRIMFGDAGNLQQNPGISYSVNQGVQWNVSSNFDPNTTPLSFGYEFFSIDISTISIQNNVTVGNETVPFQAEIGGQTGLSIGGVSGKVGFSGFKFSTRGVDDIGGFDGGGTFTLMNILSLELGEFDFQTSQNGQPVDLTFKTKDSSSESRTAVVDTTIQVNKYLHFKPGSSGNALRLSLSDGISGGVQEVLYYEGTDGELYLRIKQASLALNDMAQLTVGMELITAGSGSSGFSLMVAGGGSFSAVGIAAAGKISTLNNKLSFGVFVAAKASVNILGIVEASSLGGGFFYRPEMSDLNMVIDGVKAMDSQFQLNGPQPDVQNLKLAIMLYAGMRIGGAGEQAAVSANGLVQVTDQFTKIDANGVVFNQQDKLEVGMYLTMLYTPDIVGVEGGVDLLVAYDPLLDGTAEVDFFATKKNEQPMLWGITGNMDLQVLKLSENNGILDLTGSFIASPDGMLLELGLNKGFDIAIISGKSSFELLAWYLPDHTDPLGVYGKFALQFSICKGLAEFGASVEGGYFNRSTYHMVYFAGEAYVSVVGVIDGKVRGWVKFQTKSPNIDYGRGSNAEMEQMIADAKEKATETEQKANETKQDLDDAQNDLNNSLTDPANFAVSNQDMRKAGLRLYTADEYDYGRSSLVGQVLDAEEDLHGSNVPEIIEWISENVLAGTRTYGSPFGGYKSQRELPDIGAYGKRDAQNSVQTVQSNAPPVKQRIDDAVTALGTVSDRMRSALEQQSTLSINNPVSGVQDAAVGAGGELAAAPSFNFNTSVQDSNKSRLGRFENNLVAADQRYREAIKAAAANVELIDLVLEGDASIQWGDDTGVTMQADESKSVNSIGFDYVRALQDVRMYNSKLIGSYWDASEWADTRIGYLESNQQTIEDFGERTGWTNSQSGANKASRVAAARKYVITELTNEGSASSDSSSIGQAVRQNNSNSDDIFEQSGVDFWYRLPRLGLIELRDESEHKADSLLQIFNQKINDIETSHGAFTTSVDRLYSIKSEMLVTVYGMIEEYNAWRQEAFGQQGQNQDAPFTDKVQEIEQALTPPTIDVISGQAGEGDRTSDFYNSENRDFYGIAYIYYKALHPQGVPEISYNIMDGTEQAIYLVDDYYTGGTWDAYNQSGSERHFEMYFPKESAGQKERDLTGAVRARSPGGSTIERLVNFTVPVGWGGSEASQVVEQGDDSTPPTDPIIDHEYEYYDSKYWLADSTRISLTIKSTDPETGIQKYEYKIGTSKGGGQVRGWTEAQGSRGVGAFFIFPYSKMETTIRGLTLSPNTQYYMTFRTTNGDGMESGIKELSTPFVYDPTSPTEPVVSISPDPSNMQRQQATTQPVVRQAVSDVPNWASSRVNYENGSDDGQELTISWTASDPESDVKGVSVGSANTDQASPSQVFRPNDVDFVPTNQATEFSYTPSFDSDLYLYFRARNNVGMRSKMTVIGPMQSVDVSAPTTPDARVRGAYDGFNIYITQLADDSQSDIKGYQYAILDSTGTDTLRAWPDAGEVDFSLNSTATSSPTPPVEFIPASGFLQTGHYKVAVRAVNGQDMPSRPVMNEQVFLDRTGPTKTLAKATYVGKNQFKIEFGKIGSDPESGLKSMSYTFDMRGDDKGGFFGSFMAQMQPIEGTINNYSTSNPSYITVGTKYFEQHPTNEELMALLESGGLTAKSESLLKELLPEIQITTRNNVGLETTNRVQITIADTHLKDYKQKLVDANDELGDEKEEEKTSPFLNFKIGN